MFIERSSRRIHAARTIFLLVAVLPCVGLVAWSAHRRSEGYRLAIEGEWRRTLGVPLTVGSVEHLRPGVLRARDCRVGDGDSLILVPAIEVEATPGEVRLRIDALACDAAAARLAADLAAGWIGQAARFPQDCIVEVKSLAWEVDASRSAADVRIECVAHGGFRAIRAVRRDGATDSLRIVRGTGPEAAVDVEVRVDTPLPLAAVAAFAGWPTIGLDTAGFTGSFLGRSQGGRWTGSGSARLVDVDLAACTGMLPGQARGAATVDLHRFELRDGRIVGCDVGFEAGPGEVDRALVESLVTTLGCRPGAGLSEAAGPRRAFTRAAAAIRLDHRGIDVVGTAAPDGAVVVDDGRRLVAAPGAIIPPERLAWLVAAPGAVYVPSSGAGAWLMSVLPDPHAAPVGDAERRAERVGGDRRSDF